MNHVIDRLLADHGLVYRNGIKKMGKDLYTHVSNIQALPSDHQLFIQSVSPEILGGADFIKSSDSQVSFIFVKDLADHEPVISNVTTIKKETGKVTERKYVTNPPIYHHIWMMLPLDTDLIDITESKVRSLWWKSQMGVNRAISSKIGFLNFWNEWTATLTPFATKKIEQIYSSKNTSINKNNLPTGISFAKGLIVSSDVVVDYGCGKFSNSREEITNLGALYIGFDPFNGDPLENLLAEIVLAHIGANIIVCSNVLNVISEDNILDAIAAQLILGLKDSDSIGVITVYEGDKSEIGRVVNATQYQRNQKAYSYHNLFSDKGARTRRYKQCNAFTIQIDQ